VHDEGYGAEAEAGRQPLAGRRRQHRGRPGDNVISLKYFRKMFAILSQDVAGWPDEFVKKTPKMYVAQAIFLSTSMHNRWKKLHKNVGYLFNFQNLPKAKNRPKDENSSNLVTLKCSHFFKRNNRTIANFFA
jgi:hypothetical protein